MKKINYNQSAVRRANPSYYGNSDRAGAAVLEFAVVAPVMIFVTFGLIELGRMVMINNALIHASREGARLAVTPWATQQDVIARVKSELTPYFSAEPTITVIPANLQASAPGSQVTVRAAIGASQVSWVGGAVQLPITTLAGETIMRRESTN